LHLKFKKATGSFKQERLPVLLFLFGLLLLYFLHAFSSLHLELCLFRRVFGFNCPSCGVTRAFFAASRGEILTAIAYNPLMFVLTLIFFLYIFFQLVLRRTVALICTKKEQNILFISFLLLLLSNWIYVIQR